MDVKINDSVLLLCRIVRVLKIVPNVFLPFLLHPSLLHWLNSWYFHLLDCACSVGKYLCWQRVIMNHLHFVCNYITAGTEEISLHCALLHTEFGCSFWLWPFIHFSDIWWLSERFLHSLLWVRVLSMRWVVLIVVCGFFSYMP